MADNYLERHREEYEARKAAWLKKQKRYSTTRNKTKKA
ncbi:MAG: dehydrogenase [Prevotella sp.]|nr:dehydrogenase [Prevotella sp.]